MQVTWTKPAVVEDEENRTSEKVVESLVSDLPALSSAVAEPNTGKAWTDDEDDSGSSDDNDDFFSSSSDSDADDNKSNGGVPPQSPPAEPGEKENSSASSQPTQVQSNPQQADALHVSARPAEGSVAYHLQAARERRETAQPGLEQAQAILAEGRAVVATVTTERVMVDSVAESDSNYDSDASESDWD